MIQTFRIRVGHLGGFAVCRDPHQNHSFFAFRNLGFKARFASLASKDTLSLDVAGSIAPVSDYLSNSCVALEGQRWKSLRRDVSTFHLQSAYPASAYDRSRPDVGFIIVRNHESFFQHSESSDHRFHRFESFVVASSSAETRTSMSSISIAFAA
jgi:hypothetical protein